MQIFISHLASWLRTRRFSEPTFRPSGATNHWKNTVFCDFPTFSRTRIFFLLRLSLFDLLSSSLLFSDSSHLCFSSAHIVGSLTSKLPSTIFYWHICPIPTHSSKHATYGFAWADTTSQDNTAYTYIYIYTYIFYILYIYITYNYIYMYYIYKYITYIYIFITYTYIFIYITYIYVYI